MKVKTITGKEFVDGSWVEKPEMQTAEALVNIYRDYFRSEPTLVEVVQPANITRASKVTSATGAVTWKYSKEPFAGGESLVVCGVYLGRSKKLIWRFAKPEHVYTDGSYFEEGEFVPDDSDTYYELNTKQAKKLLDGEFKSTVDGIVGADVEAVLQQLLAIETEKESEHEKKKQSKREKQLADPKYSHYGAW